MENNKIQRKGFLLNQKVGSRRRKQEEYTLRNNLLKQIWLRIVTPLYYSLECVLDMDHYENIKEKKMPQAK